MICDAFVGYSDGFVLKCDRLKDHDGPHHDPDRLLAWGPAATTILLSPGSLGERR